MLAENGGKMKMKVKEIIEAAVPLTALAGKTPGQAVYSVLYTEAKRPGSVFKQTGKGEFKLDRKALEKRDEPLVVKDELAEEQPAA